MAVYKCKMCGGALDMASGETVVECEYCGTKQTLPKTMDEGIQGLFNRANLMRQKNEFDKAEALYEKILNIDETEAEAYWGVILCKFGIEYVEDPKTFKRIPTCHRTSYDSIVADEYYKKAIEYADATGRAVYEAEAKAIDEIQKGILAISSKEKPYDVFICYKETDENGKRTQDSVIANDIYYQLTQEGFKVFYAAITLEDKLGSAYEPIIFAALNSSKVMLAIGTNPDYFNAVWVKNEWSRFLKMMKNDRSKLLIPCYRDMDAYELPEEFAHLQAQDMSKIGFINDIIRGIKKVISKDQPKATVVKETVVTNTTASPNIAPLIKRIFIFLEDSVWAEANEYCEKVLDIDPECADAYLGKLMVEFKVKKQDELKNCGKSLYGSANYQKAVRFADGELKLTLDGINDHLKKVENERNNAILNSAKSEMQKGTIPAYNKAIELLSEISGWENADALIEEIKELQLQKTKARKKKVIKVSLSASLSAVVIALLSYFAIYPAVSVANGNYSVYIDMYNIKEYKIKDGVTSIDSYAFWGCDSLTNITIPDSVTSIGDLAFDDCDSLTSVTIPDSVTSIGNCAFEDCTNLTSVTIPDSVKSIGDSAFYNCTNLTSITIPDSVTSIGGWAFYGCSDLTSVTIGDSVTSIGDSAFEFCTNLTSVTIPDSVTSIGNCAFEDCTNLTSVTIPDNVTSIGERAFYNCYSLTSVTIPDSVTSIGDYAFYGCDSLTSVTIPDSVTSIGYGAFSGCSNLTSITIPNSVTSIGDYAFEGCDSLTSVTIGDSVTSIGNYAFSDCDSLTSVTIPDSVTSIGYGAFRGCDSLTSVTFENTEGWSADGTKISAYGLADPSTAARYLRDMYSWRIWTRK